MHTIATGESDTVGGLYGQDNKKLIIHHRNGLISDMHCGGGEANDSRESQ